MLFVALIEIEGVITRALQEFSRMLGVRVLLLYSIANQQLYS
jgi:hypothetical protein